MSFPFRAAGVLAAASTAVAALASPASAHASFPSSAAFGFAPNTGGGTGASSSVATPYAAGVTTPIVARVPYEQVDPFNGAPDTTVDVKVVVPAGWTAPSCGAAAVNKNDSTTGSTNQPGAVVPGWTCELLTVADRAVLHWSGPQVSAAQTPADSAQFFTFTVTAPSPTVQTAYNGLGGTEGFVVDQTYASGEVDHWIPSAAFPGTAPAGATTVVATGLVRTVAAVPAPPVVVPPVVETPVPVPTVVETPAPAFAVEVAPRITSLSRKVLTRGQDLTVTATGKPGTRLDLRAVLIPWAGVRNLRTAVVPASGSVTWRGLLPQTSGFVFVAQRHGATSASLPVRVLPAAR